MGAFWGRAPFIIPFTSGTSVVLGVFRGNTPLFFYYKEFFFQNYSKTYSFALKMYFVSLQPSNLASRLDIKHRDVLKLTPL